MNKSLMALKHTLWMLNHQLKLVKKPEHTIKLAYWVAQVERTIQAMERKKKSTEVA
jgi:hypothetical protein